MRHLRQEQADILLIHEPFLLGGMAYLAYGKQLPVRYKKLVVWWHSDIVRQRRLQPFYQPIQRCLLDAADAIVVATPHHITSSEVLGHYAAKCHVIHYGIEPDRFIVTPETQSRACALRAQYQKPIVLFSGRLVYYKGVEYLIRAMNRVPDAQLIVVGKGPLLPELQALAQQGPGNVAFIPFLDEPDLVAMYHASDIFVLPSIEVSEGFGIVQIEAMACGKPVVTTDLKTGVTYVNRAGETGLVVPGRNPDALADAIRTLLDDLELRVRLGETGRARVCREFTVNQMSHKATLLFEALLDSNCTVQSGYDPVPQKTDTTVPAQAPQEALPK
jgi:rhamnosyl/mannosyltransferase